MWPGAATRPPFLGGPRRPLPGNPPPPRDESEVRWLISYSDFMMQLVCLFLLLFSVSAMDKGKIHPVAQAWRQQAGIEPVTAKPSPFAGPSVPLTPAQVPGMLKDIEVVLSRYPNGGAIRVLPSSEGFRLQLVYDMFEEGSARPGAGGERLLDLAALILKPYQAKVRSLEIVGHTAPGDADREGGSALRLSMSRAREAARHLTSEACPDALNPDLIQIGGRGPHEPVADPSDPRSRPLNRRVDFAVILMR